MLFILLKNALTTIDSYEFDFLIKPVNESESLDLFTHRPVSLFSLADDIFLVYGREEIEYLCREYYVDLAAINLLDCKCENYVSYFYWSCKLNKNYILDVIRISLVTAAAYENIENLYNEKVEAGIQIKINLRKLWLSRVLELMI